MSNSQSTYYFFIHKKEYNKWSTKGTSTHIHYKKIWYYIQHQSVSKRPNSYVNYSYIQITYENKFVFKTIVDNFYI